MSSPDNDHQTELLKGIAASLKGIHSSLESLTAAVEDVSEAIEKAHEPEGDLGAHLVGALKDLVSALHKKANLERSAQPHQQHRHQQHQPRRDQQKPRPENPQQQQEFSTEKSDQDELDRTVSDTGTESVETGGESSRETLSPIGDGNKNRRPRGRRPRHPPVEKS